MFRKIAIALVATSVLAAPALAQGTTSGDSKVSPITPPTTSIAPKSEKAVTKVTKHHMVVRHHRAKTAKVTKAHAPKMAKYAKYGKAKYGKAKYGKYTHPMKHGKAAVTGARAQARAISAKPATKPSLAKPGAKKSQY
jgi:hypothetical protein